MTQLPSQLQSVICVRTQCQLLAVMCWSHSLVQMVFSAIHWNALLFTCIACNLQILSTRARKDVAIKDIKVSFKLKKRFGSFGCPSLR
jgi:hypothetical protein